MAKIAVSIPDSTLKMVEDGSNTKGMNRSQYVATAIDFYFKGAENYKIEIDRLNSLLSEKIKEFESLSEEVLPLREKLHTLENTLTDKDREIGTKANEVFQKDKRIHTLENQIVETQKKMESLSSAVLLAKEESMKAREELEKARSNATKYELAYKSKDEHIAFLESTVHQALEKITPALKPSDEEIKAKRWWQIWK